MSKVHGLMLFALFVMAPVSDAQETVWKYSGLSSVGGEPPFKTFAEVRRNGTTVSGISRYRERHT